MARPTDSTLSHCAIVVEVAANGVIVRPHAQYWMNKDNTIFEPGEIKVFNKFRDFAAWFEQFFPVLDVVPAGPEAGPEPADQWPKDYIERRARTEPPAAFNSTRGLKQ